MQEFRSRFFHTLNNTNSPQHWIALFFIFAIGFALRYYAYYFGQGYHFFTHGDELSAFEFGMRYLAGEREAQYLAQPYFGTGQVPGPFWTMLWAALYKLGGETLDGGIFAMMCLLSTATILIYALARQFLGPIYSLLSAFLFAVGPWPIYYSIGSWNPYPLVLIGGFLFLTAWRAMTKPNSKTIFLFVFFTAVVPFFHMIGVFYGVAVLTLIVLRWSILDKRWLAAGIVAGSLLYVPYIVGDATNGWQNTKKLFISDEKFTFAVVKTISGPVTTLSNLTGDWAGKGFEPYAKFGDWLAGDYRVFALISGLSALAAFYFIFSFAKQFYQVLKKNRFRLPGAFEQEPKIIFIGILLFLPLALFLLTGHNYATRYAILIMPLLFLLPSFALQRNENTLFGKKIRYTLAFIVISNMVIVGSFYQYQSDQLANGPQFMPSHRRMADIQQHLRADAGANRRIKLDFDASIEKLPGDDQGALRSVIYYLETYQTYIEKLPPNQTPVAQYRIALLADVPCNDARCVYQANNIGLVRDN